MYYFNNFLFLDNMLQEVSKIGRIFKTYGTMAREWSEYMLLKYKINGSQKIIYLL